jgi:hypothetical protein
MDGERALSQRIQFVFETHDGFWSRFFETHDGLWSRFFEHAPRTMKLSTGFLLHLHGRVCTIDQLEPRMPALRKSPRPRSAKSGRAARTSGRIFRALTGR